MTTQPKKLEEITPSDVKQAAISYAAQFGWAVEEHDCHVIPVRPQRIFRDSGGDFYVPQPTWQWRVQIRPRVPPNRFYAQLLVPVEYLSGAVAATDFIGPEHLK